MEEHSVLDYLKGKLMPWKYPRIEIPIQDISKGESFSNLETVDQKIKVDGIEGTDTTFPENEVEIDEHSSVIQGVKAKEGIKISIPWAALGALFLALFAQNSLEPSPDRSWLPGLIFYFMAFCCLGIAIYRGEWTISPIPDKPAKLNPVFVRLPELVVGLILGLAAFITSGGNRFNFFNVLLLVASILLLFRAFWVSIPSDTSWRVKVSRFIAQPSWNISISPWTLLGIAVVLLAIYFRFSQLASTPAEMNSDHAEKILDVVRLLQGQTLIFFPGNGGREALQMYLLAGLNRFAGMPLGFLTMKFSSALVGFLSLFFIYLIGKEFANRRVGLIAFAFASVAYWPNVVSRLGLRLPFYILFTAALLYFLFRGLKNTQTNDLLWAGLILGLSLYGYSADRILPLLVLSILAIYLLHPSSRPHRREVALASGGLILISIILFLPTLRFLIENPEAFLSRTFSRMAGVERALPGPAISIFLSNFWRALTMVSWSNGEVWTISIPYRPALDIITGALYWLGLVLIIIRAVVKRHWMDLSLLISIPILLLPSVMSLAFPAENPSLYRTGGALIPIFILIALALDGLMTSLQNRIAGWTGKAAAWGLALFLFLASCFLSYDLVFNQYDQQYKQSSWNSSEMGQVIRNFSETTGSPETAWVIGYPYWVDTRLVGMMAGQITRDVAFPADRLNETVTDPRPKLFILFPQDETTIKALKETFPQGVISRYPSKVPTKDFLIYYVPPIP